MELAKALDVDMNTLSGREQKHKIIEKAYENLKESSLIWKDIKDKLKNEIGEISYDIWFEPIEYVEILPTKFIIFAEAPIACKHINEYYGERLLKIIQENYSNEIKEVISEVGLYDGVIKRISKISSKEKSNWWKGFLLEECGIDLAIKNAYRDLMRTIRDFALNKNNYEIKKNAREYLKEFINKVINLTITSQEEFDKFHKEACYKLIEKFEDQTFTVGQAQKWINTTFKYLNLLDYDYVDKVYEYCHIPIDNYILNITSYKLSTHWSKLNDYDEYLKYQNWFREKYKDEIPLDIEFYLLLEEEKKNKIDK